METRKRNQRGRRNTKSFGIPEAKWSKCEKENGGDQSNVEKETTLQPIFLWLDSESVLHWF